MELMPVTVTVDHCHPNQWNKRSDKGDLGSLERSIRENGLLQPPTVRPHPTKDKGHYEIVCGERRWLACSKIGSTMQVLVRDLTDAEAQAITAVENLQRENLSPIEEAQAIQVLLNGGATYKEVAARLGQSVTWVARRGALNTLSASWRKAYETDGSHISKWTPAHLELIARFPADTQEELFTQFGSRYGWQDISAKELDRQLSGSMLKLTAAPWSLRDETLVAAAGSCVNCQKRSSCTPELFASSDESIEDAECAKNDRCLDATCWGQKLAAHHEQAFARAVDEHKEVVLFDRSEGQGLLPQDSPMKKNAIRDGWRFDVVAKGEKKAKPAYVIDGPGAGKVIWVKVKKGFEEVGGVQKRVGADGKVVKEEKSLEERREQLEKRRTVRFIAKLVELLKDNKKMALLVNKLSDRVLQALIHVFGVTTVWQLDFGWGQEWKVYDQFLGLPQHLKTWKMMAGCIDQMVRRLQGIANAEKPDREFAVQLCEVLGFSSAELLAQAVAEIPEPKSWAKDQPPPPKPVAEPKKKEIKKLEKKKPIAKKKK